MGRFRQQTQNHPKKKRCWCKRSCGRLLGRNTRRQHYAVAIRLGKSTEIALSESTSPSNSEDANDSNTDDPEEPRSGGADSEETFSNADSSGATGRLDSDTESGISFHSAADSESDASSVHDSDDSGTTSDLDEALKIKLDVSDDEWDLLDDYNFEGELFPARDRILTSEDRDNVRAFNLILSSNMTRRTFNNVRFTFRNKTNIDSEYVIFRRMGILTGIQSTVYDCCPNSCIAYTHRYKNHNSCPFCHELRFKPDGQPRHQFTYFPLIPRLQGFFQNKEMATRMSYRSKFHHDSTRIHDVFDSAHYQRLLRHRVIVDGKKLKHRYFSDSRDVALSLCTDSYLLHRRRRKGPCATPIVLQNYNLHPKYRTHLTNLICVGVIPGPHQPKDVTSFLSPLDDELAELAGGVPTFDASAKTMFHLHAYILFKLGDIIAVEKFLKIKGHNGIHPCRSCRIRGFRGGGRTYYVPLSPPNNLQDAAEERVEWDPEDLPLRKHEEFITTAARITAATSKAAKERIAKETGIKGLPGLQRVKSLDYAHSLPWEWFHLLLENIIPNLVDLWIGQFKGLDVGKEDYQIEPHIWEEIGRETAAAVKNIPASFVRVLSNIASDRSLFTAESWCFWFIHLAPKLLENRFKKRKYYEHMCELVKIMKITLEFEITLDEVDNVEKRLIEWVQKYEKYYYQYRAERLSTCTLTIHGLLHLAQGIRDCGPIWTTWTFYMERFCGTLQRNLHSRTRPWGNINKNLLHLIYREQLGVLYDLAEELSQPDDRNGDGMIGYERIVDECPNHILRPPYKQIKAVDNLLQRRIAIYITHVVGGRIADIERRIPTPSYFIGKLRIRNGGDSFRTREACKKSGSLERRNCYVRYQLVFEMQSGNPVVHVGYGDLEKIFVLNLLTDDIFGTLSGKSLVLALITPWNTEGKVASEENVYMTSRKASVVTDVRSLQAVVGLVETRRRWGIIDRTPGMQARFADEGDIEDDDVIS